MLLPRIYYISELRNIINIVKINDGGITYNRPKNKSGLFLLKRLKLSWLVFTGKCDILVWKDKLHELKDEIRN